MDEVEKFLKRVESIEFAVLIGVTLLVFGILACFNSGWKVFFLTLLAGVAVLVVLDAVARVVSAWETKQLIALIKRGTKKEE